MNVLNEVLHGFKVDYEGMLGTTREDINKLFQRLDLLSNEKEAVALSEPESRLLLKCSNLCLNEIDEDEFDTRLGELPEQARQFNERLFQHIGTGSRLP
jgi:hypothetical protein